jgi:hypothetical protein
VGSGNSSRKVVSKSGQLSIDGTIGCSKSLSIEAIPLQVPVKMHWSVQYLCGGEPEAIARGNGMIQYRYVIGVGFSNGKHTAKLSFPPNGLVDAVVFLAYKQPLHEE